MTTLEVVQKLGCSRRTAQMLKREAKQWRLTKDGKREMTPWAWQRSRDGGTQPKNQAMNETGILSIEPSSEPIMTESLDTNAQRVQTENDDIYPHLEDASKQRPDQQPRDPEPPSQQPSRLEINNAKQRKKSR